MSINNKIYKVGIINSFIGMLIVMAMFSCGNQPKVKDEDKAMIKKVLRSHLAGSWYQADATGLRNTIESYFKDAEPASTENICALILPHAGYRFSGKTAAHGVNMVKDRKYKRVVVMGPTHRVGMRNLVSVPDVTHYETPLGEVPIDLEFINKLKEHSYFISEPRAHRGEHSVQIELPLLQVALGNFNFVPIVVGQLDNQTTIKVAEILKDLVDDETLIVTSSDFTHYGENYDYLPFNTNLAENIKKLDMGAYEFIQKKEAVGFHDYISRTGATICGRYPIGILLSMLPADSTVNLVEYTTSGEMMSDYRNSVSYMSVSFTGNWKETKQAEPDSVFKISTESRVELLKLARNTLTYMLEHNKIPTPADVGVKIKPDMQDVMGAFVTLHKHKNLRGCIGEIFPRRELYKAIIEQAINAGLNDYRFRPVSKMELSEIEFEISALSPPRPVESYNDIVIGKHGVVLRKHGKQAVFLPQVAPEQGWDLATTLTHLAEKAGLPSNAWKQDASFLVFEALVFSE